MALDKIQLFCIIEILKRKNNDSKKLNTTYTQTSKGLVLM